MASKQEGVSDKQKEVWMFLVTHIERYGYQPSVREMADALGVDKRAIQDRISLLAEKGLIEIPDAGRDRALLLKNIRFKAVFEADEQRQEKE